MKLNTLITIFTFLATSNACYQVSGSIGISGRYVAAGIYHGRTLYCLEDGSMLLRYNAGDGWDFCPASNCKVSSLCLGAIGRHGFVGDNGGKPSTGNVFRWGVSPDVGMISVTCPPKYTRLGDGFVCHSGWVGGSDGVTHEGCKKLCTEHEDCGTYCHTPTTLPGHAWECLMYSSCDKFVSAADKTFECFTKTSDESYVLGATGQSCTEVCTGLGKTCSRDLSGVTRDTFQGLLRGARLGTCRDDAACGHQGTWFANDQPAFVATGMGDENEQCCLGHKNIPTTGVDCDASYETVKRVCKCEAFEDQCISNFFHTRNAAIPGHNREQLTDVTVDDCRAQCCARNWCKSFDYHKNEQKCDLSDHIGQEVGGLKTDYPGNPFDHYSTVSSSAVDVNHVNDNPGFYTCDVLSTDDSCFETKACVAEPLCPGVDGQPMPKADPGSSSGRRLMQHELMSNARKA